MTHVGRHRPSRIPWARHIGASRHACMHGGSCRLGSCSVSWPGWERRWAASEWAMARGAHSPCSADAPTQRTPCNLREDGALLCCGRTARSRCQVLAGPAAVPGSQHCHMSVSVNWAAAPATSAPESGRGAVCPQCPPTPRGAPPSEGLAHGLGMAFQVAASRALASRC